MSAQPATPAFDPDSPDEAILAAFERVRAARAYGYSFDGLPEAKWPTAELDALDAKMLVDEGLVYGNFATTATGIAAQLMLNVVSGDQVRWVDRALCEHGFLAVYARRDELDGDDKEIVEAIDELLRLEWESALAAYQQADEGFNLALKIKSLVEEEEFRLRALGATPSAYLSTLIEQADIAESRFSDEPQLDRLMRTLTPDAEALGIKARILIDEGKQEGALPWVARDTAYLAGLNANTKYGEA